MDSSGASPISSEACSARAERCDGIDNDCDGEIDEAGARGCAIAHFDDDADGFGASVAGCFCSSIESLVSNSLDCDDSRSDVHPKARERCDGEVDNDCDGFIDRCGASPHTTLVPGDLIIRRVQDRSPTLDDSLAEWFEIENTSARPIELMGLEVRDDGFDRFRIRRSLVLEPGTRAVLGRNGDPRTNGELLLDYVYSDFILSNDGDSIELRSDGLLIDRVSYSAASDLIPDMP